jgi:hypothetical protein
LTVRFAGLVSGKMAAVMLTATRIFLKPQICLTNQSNKRRISSVPTSAARERVAIPELMPELVNLPSVK